MQPEKRLERKRVTYREGKRERERERVRREKMREMDDTG